MAAAIPEYVTEKRDTAQQLGAEAGQLNAQSYNIQDELKKIMDEYTVGGKTEWSGIQGQAMSDYLQAPTQARARFYDPESPDYIFNPAKAAGAISSEIGAAEAPMLAASNLMGLFTRGEADIIGASTRDFQAKAAASAAAAQAARQAYSDTLAEFQWQQQMDLEQEKFAFQKTQANKTGGPSYSEKQSEDIKRVIREAAQAPNDEERKQYIASQGYNPGDPNFSGLFAAPTDWGEVAKQAEVYSGGGVEYTIDPSSGTITPKQEEKPWWKFWE